MYSWFPGIVGQLKKIQPLSQESKTTKGKIWSPKAH